MPEYNSKDHQSRKATETANYERLRDSGCNRDYARRTAEKASEQAHRAVDKQNSDKPSKK